MMTKVAILMPNAIRLGMAGGLLALGLILAGCSGEGESAAEQQVDLPEVRVHRVEGHEFLQRRSWQGTLAPLKSVRLQAPLTGRVAELMADSGDRVSIGTQVVRLESPELQAREQVQAERLSMAEEEWREWQRLGELGAAGLAEVNAARLQWLEAREQSDQLAAQLEGNIVRAPVAGRLVEWLIRPFSEVTQGQELAVLEDLESIGLRLVMPTREAEDLKAGTGVRLMAGELGELPIASMLAQAGENGFVTLEVMTSADVEVPRQVELVRERRTEALLVPWTAVASDDDGHWVAVIDPGSGEVRRRVVELGHADASGVEVLSGLESGELVARYRPRSLTEGRQVRAIAASQEGEDEA